MDKTINLFYKDLKKYSNDEIFNLAKHMKISYNYSSLNDLRFQIAKKQAFIFNETLPEDQNPKCKRYKKKFSKYQLNNIRKTIYKNFSEFKNSVSKMSSENLYDLFRLYDKLCFNNDIIKYIRDNKLSLKFKTLGEDTFTTEGVCLFKKCEYIITIPLHYFDNINGITNVAGHMCNDQLECLLRVIEHELVHLIIFMFCGDMFVAEQHGKLFMNMVKQLFHHTDHRHYIF